jgi:hypothetical protein
VLIAIDPRHDLAMFALLQIFYREVAADQSSGSSKNACMMIVIIYFSKHNKLPEICQPS